MSLLNCLSANCTFFSSITELITDAFKIHTTALMIVPLMRRSPKTMCWCVYFFLPWKISSCFVGSAVPGDLTSISARLMIYSREMFTSGWLGPLCHECCVLYGISSPLHLDFHLLLIVLKGECVISAHLSLSSQSCYLKQRGSKFHTELSWADHCQRLRVWLYYVRSQGCSLFIPFVIFYRWDRWKMYRRFVQALWKMRVCLKPSHSSLWFSIL